MSKKAFIQARKAYQLIGPMVQAEACTLSNQMSTQAYLDSDKFDEAYSEESLHHPKIIDYGKWPIRLNGKTLLEHWKVVYSSSNTD